MVEITVLESASVRTKSMPPLRCLMERICLTHKSCGSAFSKVRHNTLTSPEGLAGEYSITQSLSG